LNSISKRAYITNFIKGFDEATISNKNYYLKVHENFIYDYRLRYFDKKIMVCDSITSKQTDFKKPKSKLNNTWSTAEKQSIEKWFINYKLNTHYIDNVFAFDDAYFFSGNHFFTVPPSCQSSLPACFSENHFLTKSHPSLPEFLYNF